ncbi:Uncharacterised protein [Citrobacter koseri]|uniref:Uncharacterized protein n=1 Tax=Citrobacter koseri TaxID=545 RepID=A0A2X2X1R8_CITKO|nr:Uncharacterised protein [Citrobacter koseri]
MKGTGQRTLKQAALIQFSTHVCQDLLRIGSLDDAGKTEDVLLSFALAPLQKELENARA